MKLEVTSLRLILIMELCFCTQFYLFIYLFIYLLTLGSLTALSVDNYATSDNRIIRKKYIEKDAERNGPRL